MTWRLSRPPGRSARSQVSKKVAQVLGADRLEHLDRDDRVEGALDVAVVAQLDIDQVVQPGRADPLPGQLELLLRDRDRRDPTAQLAGCVQREAAPPGADLQDVLAGAQAGVGGHPAVLVALGSASDWSGRLEDGAGVGQRLVEEQPVEVVAQVVVGRDVARGCRRECCAACGGRRSGRAGPGRRNQPPDSASAARLRAASRSSAARSGLDHSPSM